MVFGFVFNVDLCKNIVICILKNGFDCEFKFDILSKGIIFKYDCGVLLAPAPSPTPPRPTTVDVIDNDIGVCEYVEEEGERGQAQGQAEPIGMSCLLYHVLSRFVCILAQKCLFCFYTRCYTHTYNKYYWYC